MSKKRSRTDEKRDPKTVAFWGFMALALVVGVGMYWVSESRTPPASAGPAYVPVAPVVPAPTMPPLAFDEIKNRLHGDTPLTIVVAGDSTGNDPGEWVYLTAQKMADLGRRVTVHDWSLDTNGYVSEKTIGPDAGAPVAIWNSSASGQNADYSAARWTTIAPQGADLVIVNHGHNQGSAQNALDGIAKLIDLAHGFNPPAATAVTVQNPSTGDLALRDKQVGDAVLGAYGKSVETPVFDVRAAYEQSGNVPGLLTADGLHPNAQGEQVWASVVAAAFGI